MTHLAHNSDKSLSQDESMALRGICISLIVLHNFIHNVVPFAENEKWFNPENADFFINNIMSHPVLGSFSYLGWLGVPLFFFLSGYGLNKKYGNSIPNVITFIKSHYIKLLILAGPIILIKNIKLGTSVFCVMGQLTFLNGFWGDTLIYPKAFWYLRVAFEFYIIYVLILRYIPPKVLLGCATLVTCSFLFFSNDIVRTMKYHCVGWSLDFALGIYSSHHPRWIKQTENVYCSVLLMVIGLFSSVNGCVWIFSSTIALMFFLSIKRFITNKLLVFMGTMSAFLFVTHPIVRDLWLHLNLDYMNGSRIYASVSVCSYLLTCLLIAVLYGWIYKRVLAFIQNLFFKT